MSFITEQDTDEILTKLSQNSTLMLSASTGSGKSTIVPERIVKEKATIVVVEPTITAVKSLYEREKKIIGDKYVGYAADLEIKYKNDFLNKIRKSDKLIDPEKFTGNTPLVYMTDGHVEIFFWDILKYVLNLIDKKIHISKINVSFCDILMIDEAHSNNLNILTIISIWKYLYNFGVKVPKLLLASATLDFNHTQFTSIVRHVIDTQTYPVNIEYINYEYPHLRKINSPELYIDLVNIIYVKHLENKDFLKDGESDTWLVFCAGSNEVEKTCTLLREKNDPYLMIVAAYADISEENKIKIFTPTPLMKRKIIVSTNVAETSITISGLSGVFDSLTEKITKTSSSGGIKLDLVPISKSSAKQRAGRTGRTKPGFCFRMCSEKYFNTLSDQREPEVDRIPINNLLIKIYSLGLNPKLLFPNLNNDRIQKSIELLIKLEMIKKHKVTELGIFATKLSLSVSNTSIIYKWVNEGYDDIFPCLSVMCLLDSYSNGYFYVPKKTENKTKEEYSTLINEHYETYFSKYNHASDIGILLNLWFDFIDNCGDYETVNYNKILKFSNDRSLNNKNFSNFITNIKQTTNVLKYHYKFNVTTTKFDINECIEILTPMLENIFPIIEGSPLKNKYKDYDDNTFYINEGKKNLTTKEIALLTFQSGNKNIVLLSTPLK